MTPQTHHLSQPLAPGHIYRINTGSPLPTGTDAVIMVEDTELVSTSPDSAEEATVKLLAPVKPGENVRKPGSDTKRGDLALVKGDVIGNTGGEIGTLAFVGRKDVQVYRKPVVAILSTGNEIADLHTGAPNQESGRDGWTGVFDTNRPSLYTALQGLGYDVVDLGVISDELRSFSPI